MNIFFVSNDPRAAASCLYGRHRLKMLVESTQLLCTAVRYLCPQKFDDEIVYASTHENHPCSQWARASLSNFLWLADHANHLTILYATKYGKRHRCWDVLYYIGRLHLDFDKLELTEPPQCMHEKYKGPNPIAAYRRYYVAEKGHVFDKSYGDNCIWGSGWADGAPEFPVGKMHQSAVIDWWNGLY